jgi:hypothetical protein
MPARTRSRQDRRDPSSARWRQFTHGAGFGRDGTASLISATMAFWSTRRAREPGTQRRSFTHYRSCSITGHSRCSANRGLENRLHWKRSTTACSTKQVPTGSPYKRRSASGRYARPALSARLRAPVSNSCPVRKDGRGWVTSTFSGSKSILGGTLPVLEGNMDPFVSAASVAAVQSLQ